MPRGRRSQTTPPTASIAASVSKTQVLDKEHANVILATNSSTNESNQSSKTIETNPQDPVKHANEATVPEPPIETTQDSLKPQLDNHTAFALPIDNPTASPPAIDSIANMADSNTKCDGGKIETPLNSSDKDYNEEKEFQRASKVQIK